MSIAVGNDGSKWFGSKDGVLTCIGQTPYKFIQLVSPAARDTLDGGSSCKIKWKSHDVDMVTLSYSTDDGENWVTIDENVAASAGSYEWTIPDLESDSCFLRISDQSNESIIGKNVYAFNIVPGESIVEPSPKTGNWKYYANMNNINALLTNDGYLYSATTAGVVKWNMSNRTVSETFTTANGLYSNRVYAIAIDDTGYLWLGTADKVSYFDGETWRSSSIPTINLDEFANNYYISALAFDQEGILWAGTSSGTVASFDGNSWDIHFQGAQNDYEPVTCIRADADNVKWVSIYSNGVRCYDDSTWLTYTPADGLASNNVNTIAIDDDNVKWFGTTGGLSFFDGTTWGKYTKADGLSGSGVSSIAIDANGVKWIGTHDIDDRVHVGTGVSVFDGTTWESYSADNSLAYDYVSSIVIDDSGRKWFGYKKTDTYSLRIDIPGIQSFDDATWRSLIKDGPENNKITSIAFEENGTVWFGTLEGVLSYDGNNWESYNLDDCWALRHGILSVGVDKNNTKWFGTSENIVSFDGSIWKDSETSSYPELSQVNSIVTDHNGNLWFGSLYDGVYKFNGSTWENFTSFNSGLSNDHVHSLTVDHNNVVWFGCRRSVSSYDGIKWNTFGLPETATSLDVDDNNTIWGYQNNGAGSFLINENGLSKDVSDDNMTKKWFGGQNGCLVKYSESLWDALKTGGSIMERTVNDVSVSPDGQVWIGTENGISCYTYDTPTSIESPEETVTAFPVVGNYPNPFNPLTTITFQLAADEHIELAIYNITGQKIRTLISETMNQGNHSIRWDGTDEKGLMVSSGIYFAHIRTNSFSTAHKMLFMR